MSLACAGCICNEIEPTNRHRTPQTARLLSELHRSSGSLAELDGSTRVKSIELSTEFRAESRRVVHRLSTGLILHHALSSTSHNGLLDQFWDSSGSILQTPMSRKSYIRAFRQNSHESFGSAPTRTLEMDWISCPNSRHWNRASVAIWIACQFVVHGSFDRFRLSTDFASIIVFSHAHPPID